MWLLGCGLALAVILSLAVSTQRPWPYFLRMLSGVQWVLVLTLGVLYGLRHRLARLRPQHTLWIAVGLLAMNTWLLGEVLWLLLRDSTEITRGWWRSFSLRMTASAIIVGLLGALAIQNHWRSRQLAVRAKQAELDALRARVNPHFLFNALNTATALVHSRPDQAEQVLLDMSDLFRAALAGGTEHALADELALIERYLEIEQLRLGQRLQLQWELPMPLPQVAVPTLALQALVENAVQHGIERISEGGVLGIRLLSQPGQVLVQVSNPLPQPADAAKPGKPASGHGVGLAAARARLESMQPPGQLQLHEDGAIHVAEARIALAP